jgi:hypothetical protein
MTIPNIAFAFALRSVRFWLMIAFLSLAGPSVSRAGAGDPQIGTDHPWYPGELACSTFDRL